MPIEKEKYAPRGSSYAVQERFNKQRQRERARIISSLRKDIQSLRYDERGQDSCSRWRKDVATDLNTVLAGIDYALRTDDISEIRLAEAALRIVRRVEEFEGIRRAK